MSKRVLVVLLVGVNVLLLAALILTVFSPPRAMAQAAAAAARRGETMLFSARAEVGNDAVYLLDSGARQLHVFRTTFPRVGGQPTRVRYVTSRDLSRDFAAQPGADRGRQ